MVYGVCTKSLITLEKKTRDRVRERREKTKRNRKTSIYAYVRMHEFEGKLRGKRRIIWLGKNLVGIANRSRKWHHPLS